MLVAIKKEEGTQQKLSVGLTMLKLNDNHKTLVFLLD